MYQKGEIFLIHSCPKELNRLINNQNYLFRAQITGKYEKNVKKKKKMLSIEFLRRKVSFVTYSATLTEDKSKEHEFVGFYISL